MTEHVPTVADLIVMGLASEDRHVPKGGMARIRVSDEGHALMGRALRANGQAARERGEGDWRQPPSTATRWWTEEHWTDGTPVDEYELRKAGL